MSLIPPADISPLPFALPERRIQFPILTASGRYQCGLLNYNWHTDCPLLCGGFPCGVALGVPKRGIPSKNTGFGRERTSTGLQPCFFCLKTAKLAHGRIHFAECQPNTAQGSQVRGIPRLRFHVRQRLSSTTPLSCPSLLTRRSITKREIIRMGFGGTEKLKYVMAMRRPC